MATEEFFINNRRRLSWVQETSYGAGGDMAANGSVVGINHTFEPGEWSRGWAEIINNGADSRQIQDWVVGIKDQPWIMKFNPVDWSFLKYSFDMVEAGSDPYTHTFTEGGCLESFELENVVFATSPRLLKLLGGYVNSTTITWSKQTGPNDGFVEVSLDCNAQAIDPSLASASAVSSITAKPFRAHHALVTINDVDITEVNSGEIIIEQGLDVNDYTYASNVNDENRGAPIPKTLRITGTININVKDESIFDLFTADVEVPGTNKIEIGRSATDNVVFTWDKFIITKAIDDGADVEGVVNMDIVFSAKITDAVATDSIQNY